jgi:hypothetical protein
MPAPFYCLVVNNNPHRGGPVVAHATLEKAETEAARLHAKLEGRYAVRVLETVRELPSMAPIEAPAPLPDKPPEAVNVPPVKVLPKEGKQAAKPPAVPPKAKSAPVVVVKKKRVVAQDGV